MHCVPYYRVYCTLVQGFPNWSDTVPGGPWEQLHSMCFYSINSEKQAPTAAVTVEK